MVLYSVCSNEKVSCLHFFPVPHYSHDVVFNSSLISVMKMYIVYSFETASSYQCKKEESL